MWREQLHWPIAALLLGIALHLFRRQDRNRATMFLGMAIATFGREHVVFLIAGATVALYGVVRLHKEREL